jgi:hypothetical protein
MLLKSLDALNGQGSQLHLSLDDAVSGFSVKEIEGLDPVAATISSGTFAMLDGEQYYSARRQKRNIKITLGLNPDFAVSDVKTLRDQLYSYFMPKSNITLTFNMFDRFAETLDDQNLNLTIDGVVESFDSPLFVQDPQVVISILNFNPDFVDPREILVQGSMTDLPIIDYRGSVSTGILLTVRPLQPNDGSYHTTSFGVTHITPDGAYHNLDLTWDLYDYQGQSIQISSVPGDKYAKFSSYEGEFVQSVLYALSTTSVWITLQPGLNRFLFTHGGDPTGYTIQYTNKYGGL